MAMNTVTFSKTVGLTKFEKPMLIQSQERAWDWKKLFTMGKMNAGTMQFYQYTGFGQAEQLGELQLVPFDQAYELDSVTLTAVKYVKGFMLSEELEDDNQQIGDLLGQWGRALGRSHAYAQDLCAASIFNNAQSSSYTGWDSLALLSNSHSTQSGTTIDNLYAASTFSWDVAWDLEKYFAYQIYDEAGLPITDEPAYLVYHPVLRDTVQPLYKSPQRYDVNDNEVNTLKKMQLVECKLLSTTTNYFMLGSEMKNYLQFRQRRPLRTAWEDAFQNMGRFCRTDQRFAYGFTDYRFIIGSTGA